MIIRRKRHKVPALNTTSTADISFMLLIFFLVTTSMDVDKGLMRQLPPAQTEQMAPPTDVDKATLLEVKVTADNKFVVNGKPVATKDMRRTIAEFITRLGRQHLISIDADPSASYDAYFSLQNEMVAAYRDVRNTMAMKKYHRRLEQCSQQQRDAIRDAMPQKDRKSV